MLTRASRARSPRSIRARLRERDAALPWKPPAWLLWSVPVVGTLGVLPLWFLWKRGYWGITGEDRLAEWSTFVAYLAVAALALVVARRLAAAERRVDAVLYFLFALGALFVAGEEVNWLQRQLGFAGPHVIVERNRQDAANVHNILAPDALHALFFVVALYASVLARWVVPRLPVVRERPHLYVAPASLAAWFACTWLFYAAVYVGNPILRDALGDDVTLEDATGPRLEEVVELALAGGFLLFVLRIVHGRLHDPPSRPNEADPGPANGAPLASPTAASS